MFERQVTNTAGLALRRLQLDNRRNQNDVTQNVAKADPQMQQAAWQFHYDKTARIVIGTITDTCALAHVYRVQYEKGHPPIPCCVAPLTSHSLMGVRDIRTLQAGNMVVALIHEQLNYGLIIATVPTFYYRRSFDTLEDLIFLGTRNRVDEGHKKPLRMPENGSIPDLLAGRPFDSTTAGEWGYQTSTGLRIYLDDFMAQIGNGEACGITSFYHDDLLRVAAYNLQMWMAGAEREAFNDQDEYDDKDSSTAYPWEQLGKFERTDPTKIIDPYSWQREKGTPWYCHWEPKIDDLQPWHRHHLFKGYFGQGRKDHQQTWPKEKPEWNLYYEQPDMIYMGLHDDTVTMTGERHISSVKRISIQKRVAVITPKRVMRPEQLVIGDTEANYKFSSLLGGGPDHKITSDIKTTFSKDMLQRAAGILDMHGYFYNYNVFMGFYWHAKDWFTPEESQLTHIEGMHFKPVEFFKLDNYQYLDPPTPVQWDIDHRLKNQKFWQNECGVDFLEDGGVVLYGGWGEEIRMTAGHIFLSAPGDIWVKSGRNTNVWAGYDVILRAKNSMDLTTTCHDVRVGAGRNVQVVAGMDRREGKTPQGAVMIESRGEGATYDYEKGGEQVQSNGIQLKSRKAEIVNWAQNIYLRTGGGNVEQGEICIDASKGKRNITTYSENLYNYLDTDGGVYHFFGRKGDIKKANEFTRTFTLLCSWTGINGMSIINGDILNKGWVLTAHGHIATEYAPAFMFLVAPLLGKALQAVLEACEMVKTTAEKTLPDFGKELFQEMMDVLWYNEGRPGSDKTIRQAEATLRALDEYKTTGDWLIMEDRWQQLGRLAGTAQVKWKELALHSEVGQRMPFPGRENFTSPRLYQQDLRIFDASKGQDKDRGKQPSLAGIYRDPLYLPPVPVSLQDYLVIRPDH